MSIWAIIYLTVRMVAILISPVCYSITEDSEIFGCNFQNGEWRIEL